MRMRASFTSAATYGAGVSIAAAFSHRRHARLGDARPLQAGDLRAGPFLDVEPQHADRAVDGERPADDLGLQEALPRCRPGAARVSTTVRSSHASISRPDSTISAFKALARRARRLPAKRISRRGDRRAGRDVDAQPLGIGRRADRFVPTTTLASSFEVDEVAAHAMRQVVDQELIEDVLVPRLFELLDQARRRDDAVDLEDRCAVRASTMNSRATVRASSASMRRVRDARFEVALRVERLANAIDVLLQLEEIELVARLDLDLGARRRGRSPDRRR